jgi:hypothetical protein
MDKNSKFGLFFAKSHLIPPLPEDFAYFRSIIDFRVTFWKLRLANPCPSMIFA